MLDNVITNRSGDNDNNDVFYVHDELEEGENKMLDEQAPFMNCDEEGTMVDKDSEQLEQLPPLPLPPPLPSVEHNPAGGKQDVGILQPKKRGIMILWQNVANGRINLLRKDYTFPFLNLCHLFVVWHCEISINFPTYKNLSFCDVENIKGGSQKLSTMRYLMNHMHRGAWY
jgi:hypothetical protein